MKNILFLFKIFVTTLIIVITLWTISYVDYKNMINNGYVNKNSAEFFIESTEKVLQVKEVDTPYILIQFDSLDPSTRFIYTNGKVKLPPVNFSETIDINNVKKYAIVGKNYSGDLRFYSDYDLIGKFNTPDSYLLNSQLWLLDANSHDINLSNGNRFILSSINNDSTNIVNQILKDKEFHIISTQESGTYILQSNMTLKISLVVFLIFTMVTYIILSIREINGNRNILRILYQSGGKIKDIFIRVFIEKILIVLLVTICFIIFFYFPFNKYTFWDNTWVNHSSIFLIFYVLFFVVYCILVAFTIIKKGG